MKDYMHFSAGELKCKCGKCDGGQMDDNFMSKIVQLRIIFNKPIHIDSGFRCRAHNKAEDGSKNSAHMRGRAVDIRITPENKSKLLELAIHLGFKRLGFGKTFLHLDDMKESEGYYQGWWTY